MKHVPKYLMPKVASASAAAPVASAEKSEVGTAFVPFSKVRGRGQGRGRGRGRGRFAGAGGGRGGKKKTDPLKKFR